ncbi:MAG: NUDIX domain-containing protein [Gemmatimonadaceae bacterium]
MTHVAAGTIDVYLVRQSPGGLEALALRRAPGARCSGAWETVHGRIEQGETPADTALREVAEETGLSVARLYNVACHAFYLQAIDTVNVAIAFAAFPAQESLLSLSAEHDKAEWLPLARAAERFSWPRAEVLLRDIEHLLQHGDAGPLEDVLRVR